MLPTCRMGVCPQAGLHVMLKPAFRPTYSGFTRSVLSSATRRFVDVQEGINEGKVVSATPVEVVVDVRGKQGILAPNDVSLVHDKSSINMEQMFSEGEAITVYVNKILSSGELELSTKWFEKVPGDILHDKEHVFKKAQPNLKNRLRALRDLELGSCLDATIIDVHPDHATVDIGCMWKFALMNKHSVSFDTVDDMRDVVKQGEKLKVLVVGIMKVKNDLDPKKVWVATNILNPGSPYNMSMMHNTPRRIAVNRKVAHPHSAHPGKVRDGKVVSVHDTYVVVDVGALKPGYLTNIDAGLFTVKHMSEAFSVGDDVQVMCISEDEEDDWLNFSRLFESLPPPKACTVEKPSKKEMKNARIKRQETLLSSRSTPCFGTIAHVTPDCAYLDIGALTYARLEASSFTHVPYVDLTAVLSAGEELFVAVDALSKQGIVYVATDVFESSPGVMLRAEYRAEVAHSIARKRSEFYQDLRVGRLCRATVMRRNADTGACLLDLGGIMLGVLDGDSVRTARRHSRQSTSARAGSTQLHSGNHSDDERDDISTSARVSSKHTRSSEADRSDDDEKAGGQYAVGTRLWVQLVSRFVDGIRVSAAGLSSPKVIALLDSAVGPGAGHTAVEDCKEVSGAGTASVQREVLGSNIVERVGSGADSAPVQREVLGGNTVEGGGSGADSAPVQREVLGSDAVQRVGSGADPAPVQREVLGSGSSSVERVGTGVAAGGSGARVGEDARGKTGVPVIKVNDDVCGVVVAVWHSGALVRLTAVYQGRKMIPLTKRTATAKAQAGTAEPCVLGLLQKMHYTKDTYASNSMDMRRELSVGDTIRAAVVSREAVAGCSSAFFLSTAKLETAVGEMLFNKQGLMSLSSVSDDAPEPGSRVSGVVDSVTDHAVFVKLDCGMGAVLHVTHVSKLPIQKLKNMFKAGDKVEAVVLPPHPTKRGIQLSTKELESVPGEMHRRMKKQAPRRNAAQKSESSEEKGEVVEEVPRKRKLFLSGAFAEGS